MNGTRQRLPCVKGAGAKRLRDCAVQSVDFESVSAKRFAETTLRKNLPGLTAPGQNGGSSDLVRSDDGHTGKSSITTPQSASLTAPLTQGSLWCVLTMGTPGSPPLQPLNHQCALLLTAPLTLREPLARTASDRAPGKTERYVFPWTENTTRNW